MVVAELRYLQWKAVELAWLVVKLREDDRVCLLGQKIKALHAQIYDLEWWNQECFDTMARREKEKEKGEVQVLLDRLKEESCRLREEAVAVWAKRRRKDENGRWGVGMPSRGGRGYAGGGHDAESKRDAEAVMIPRQSWGAKGGLDARKKAVGGGDLDKGSVEAGGEEAGDGMDGTGDEGRLEGEGAHDACGVGSWLWEFLMELMEMGIDWGQRCQVWKFLVGLKARNG